MEKHIVLTIVLCLLLFFAAFTFSGGISDQVLHVMGQDERMLPIYCVETDKPEIAITFDAAWGNEDTDQLISILNEYDAKATFFVTGDFAQRCSEDVKKFRDNGHDIANHSFSHPHIDSLSREELLEDIEKCNSLLESLLGTKPLLYRGPYGEYSNTLLTLLDSTKQYCIQWDVDSLDWKDPSPEQMHENIIKKVGNGSILLFHNGAKNTPQALPGILAALKEKGYSFVLVRDLIYQDNYMIDHTGRQKKL